MDQLLSLSFLASIYFYARGVFALFGQTTFYTKRNLENLDPEDVPAYLKEIGRMNMVVATVFLGKALLNVVAPYSRPVLYGFLLALLFCCYGLNKIDAKYKK